MILVHSHKIASVHARQILDSRGIPTVEATVVLDDGTYGRASVPSGASTGKYEACEKRDGDKEYGGKSVFAAVNAVETVLRDAILDLDPTDLYRVDSSLCKADGTENKGRLGANAILAVSLASAKAAANVYRMPLFRYLGGARANRLPMPFMNILNGGAHASNNLDIQEFMIVPIGACDFAEAMRMGCETYSALKGLLKKDSLSVAIGDEGGFAPDLSSDKEALQYITDAIEAAGYVPGKDIALALDVASSEWQEGDDYHLPKKNKMMTAQELALHYNELVSQYPIISLEDPFGEEDWEAFRRFTTQMSDLQIVGDDLFVTNPHRIRKGIELHAANAVLIKPNQIGTLSETLQAISLAHRAGYKTMISHRSGETCDSFIADLAVATNSGQIKTGAPCRGERLAKYNRLLAIEKFLGDGSCYGFSD